MCIVLCILLCIVSCVMYILYILCNTYCVLSITLCCILSIMKRVTIKQFHLCSWNMLCIGYCNPEYPIEGKTDVDPLSLKISPVPYSVNKLQIPIKVKLCDTFKKCNKHLRITKFDRSNYQTLQKMSHTFSVVFIFHFGTTPYKINNIRKTCLSNVSTTRFQVDP